VDVAQLVRAGKKLNFQVDFYSSVIILSERFIFVNSQFNTARKALSETS
jgi:hypothetical protein